MKSEGTISQEALQPGRFLPVIDAMPAAFLCVDGQGIVQAANAKMEEFFDLVPRDIVGKRLEEFVEPFSRSFTEIMSYHEVIVQPMQDHDREFLKDVEISLPKHRYLQFMSGPMGGDTYAGRVWVIRDITQEREITELKIQYGGVRSADALKSKFMTVISHQLRTPLNSLRWNSELLLSDDYDLSDELKEILQQMYASVVNSIGIVDEMLVAVDIERRVLKLEKAVVDTADIINKVVDDFRKTAEMRSVKLVVRDMPKNAPRLFLDRERMEMALGRIVDNAITYSPGGMTVEIGVRAGKKDVTIEVIDHGVGIPESEKSRVFEKFFRAKEAIKLNPNASGLGLYITKYIVEAHDGKIDFMSEEGKGTKFMLMLPRKLAA